MGPIGFIISLKPSNKVKKKVRIVSWFKTLLRKNLGITEIEEPSSIKWTQSCPRYCCCRPWRDLPEMLYFPWKSILNCFCDEVQTGYFIHDI